MEVMLHSGIRYLNVKMDGSDNRNDIQTADGACRIVTACRS